MSAPTHPEVAFYCVCDERYFLGAVGMINSLRLLGHTEPVYVLDGGLAPGQRELLRGHATVVPAPDGAAPQLLKSVAPLRHPARTMVLIDADMIVTRPLANLIEWATESQVVAFRDRQERFFPEWGELLGLGAPRSIPYVSSGLVFLGGDLGADVIRLMERGRERVDFSQTFWRRNDRDYPFLYADQDVLNAILATCADGEVLAALETRLAATPPFRRLRLVDERTLRCAYPDGTEPYVLHQFVRKPWLEPMYHGIYSRMLARLLLADDVAIRVPEDAVPVRMRRGARARAERTAVNVRDLGRFYLGDLLPGWIGQRVEDWRRRRAGAAQ
jgi:hypothetical protein